MPEPDPSDRTMAPGFSDLGIDSDLAHELQTQGIDSPFPIQQESIPDALSGRDILGSGPTGSGKTLAFGLPMIQRLTGGHSLPGHPRGLILLPTRELAQQVSERLAPLAALKGLRVLTFVGGVNISKNITALARPVDIAMGTPGRINDLIEQRKLRLDQVEITVLDEADQMADMGFLPQVRKLLRQIPHGGQNLFFSATLDGEIQVLVDEFLEDPLTHSTGNNTATVNTMEHFLVVFPDSIARNQGVVQAARQADRTIMFARTKRGVDRQVQRLGKAHVDAVGLHGDKGQNSRENSLCKFSTGEVPVLVATDIAARGIDIPDLDTVVHIEPPAEHKAYVHRAGRTARAGNSGRVITFTLADDLDKTLGIMKKAKVSPAILDVEQDPDALTNLLGSSPGESSTARRKTFKADSHPHEHSRTSQRNPSQSGGKRSARNSGSQSSHRSKNSSNSKNQPHTRDRRRNKKKGKNQVSVGRWGNKK